MILFAIYTQNRQTNISTSMQITIITNNFSHSPTAPVSIWSTMNARQAKTLFRLDKADNSRLPLLSPLFSNPKLPGQRSVQATSSLSNHELEMPQIAPSGNGLVIPPNRDIERIPIIIPSKSFEWISF